MTGCLLGLVLAAQTQGPIFVPMNDGQGHRREVEGVLLVTGDPAEAKRARRYPLSTDAEIRRRFSSARYETVAWGDRYRLLVDRTTGPLGAIADRTLIERAFAKGGDGSGVVEVSGMTPGEYGAVKSWVGEWPGEGQPATHQEPTFLGILVDHEIVLKAGTDSRSFAYRVADPHRESTLASLRQKSPSGSPSVLSAADRSIDPPSRDEYDFVYLGVAGSDRTEGLRLATDAIGKIEARLRRDSYAAAQDLFKALGYHLAPGSPGASDPSQMPSEMRRQVQDQLQRNWNSLGFADRSEALAFLARANFFEVHTNIAFRQTLDPGDPSRMRSSSGVSWQIQDLPGAYLP